MATKRDFSSLVQLMANDGRAPSFDSAGTIRGFRSQRGAPQAQPTDGLTTPATNTVASPVSTVASNTAWGNIFKSNSVFGGRNAAAEPPVAATPDTLSGAYDAAKTALTPAPVASKPAYGTAANPINFTGFQRDAITTARTGAAQTATPFMPNANMLSLPNQKLSPTDASGDTAALQRNLAMTQPGGLNQFQTPVTARSAPGDILRSTVGSLVDWHQKAGVPLPTTRGTNTALDLPGGRMTRNYVTPYGKASVSSTI